VTINDRPAQFRALRSENRADVNDALTVAAWRIRKQTNLCRIDASKRDGFSSKRHPALGYCWSMMFSENRYALFGIML